MFVCTQSRYVRWDDQSRNYPRTRCTDPLDIRLVASLLPLSACQHHPRERQVPPRRQRRKSPSFRQERTGKSANQPRLTPPVTALSHLPRGPWRTIYRDSQGDAGVLPGLWRGALQGTRGHLGREKAGEGRRTRPMEQLFSRPGRHDADHSPLPNSTGAKTGGSLFNSHAGVKAGCARCWDFVLLLPLHFFYRHGLDLDIEPVSLLLSTLSWLRWLIRDHLLPPVSSTPSDPVRHRQPS